MSRDVQSDSGRRPRDPRRPASGTDTSSSAKTRQRPGRSRAARRRAERTPRVDGDAALQRRLDAMERRESGGQVVKYALFVLVTLSLTLLILHMIFGQTRSQPLLHVVQRGRLESSVGMPALVVRDETLLSAPETGYIRHISAEGERYPADAVVAYIVPEDHGDLVREADRLSAAMTARQLELMMSEENPDILEPYLAWDASLLPVIRQLRTLDPAEAAYKVNDYNLMLDSVLRQRSAALWDEDYDDATLRELAASYREVSDAIRRLGSAVTLPHAGQVSFRLPEADDVTAYYAVRDALDDEAEDADDPKDTTAEDGPAETEEAPDAGNTTDAAAWVERLTRGGLLSRTLSEVEQGEGFARTVTGATQTFHYHVSTLDGWLKGTRYDIDIPSEDLVIRGAVLTDTEALDTGYHLTFESDLYVEALMDKDVVETVIRRHSQEAIRVPVEALVLDPRSDDLGKETEVTVLPPRVEDLMPAPDSADRAPEAAEGRVSVYRLDAGYVRQIPVEVLDMTDRFALVQSPEGVEAPLKQGQIILLNPEAGTPGEPLSR